MEIIFAIVGVIFAGVGLFFAGAAVLSVFRSILSRNWYPVPGTIVASEVSVNVGSSSSPTGASYDPRITYEYEVNGRLFTGNNLNFSRFRTNTPGQASNAVRHYPAGKTVTVYHDPIRPERSVLEPGKIGVHISGFIVGAAVTLFGTFFVLGGWFGFEVVTERIGKGMGIDEEFVWSYFPPFVILVGTGLVVGGIIAGIRSRRAHSWPTVEGTIIASGVVREHASGSSNSMVTGGQNVYKPEVAYEYEINGERYVSNRIELLDVASSNQGRAQSIQSNYKPGDQVRVYYDPENPERSLLKPGGWGGSCLMIVVGAGFIIIASIIMGLHSIAIH